jgi:hypothetical protein
VREKGLRVLAGLDAGSPIEIQLTREDMLDDEDEGEAAMYEDVEE